MTLAGQTLLFTLGFLVIVYVLTKIDPYNPMN